MRFDIITIFPNIFDSYFKESIIKRAQEKGKIKIKIWDLRDFAKSSRLRNNRESVKQSREPSVKSRSTEWSGHKKVDDRPFGGGAGMILMAEPILRAVQKIKPDKKNKIIILSAKGKQFNQKIAYNWSKKHKNFIFITGRYEGIDDRVSKILRAEEISIGPYIATDGDVAVMAIISALSRLIPRSIHHTSF